MEKKLPYTVKSLDGTNLSREGFVKPLLEELEYLQGPFDTEEEWMDAEWREKHILDLFTAYHIQVLDQDGAPMNMEDEKRNEIDLSGLMPSIV